MQAEAAAKARADKIAPGADPIMRRRVASGKGSEKAPGESGGGDGGSDSFDEGGGGEGYDSASADSDAPSGDEASGNDASDGGGKDSGSDDSRGGGAAAPSGGGGGASGGAGAGGGASGDGAPGAARPSLAAAVAADPAFGRSMALRERRADPSGWPMLYCLNGHIRVSQNADMSWDFRAICNVCQGTKAGTCRPAPVSAGRLKRGQGRPGGLLRAFLELGIDLAPDHSKNDHYDAALGLSYPKRKVGRRLFDDEVALLAAWFPARPPEWPLERKANAELDDSDGEPKSVFDGGAAKAFAKAVVKPAAKPTPKTKAAAKTNTKTKLISLGWWHSEVYRRCLLKFRMRVACCIYVPTCICMCIYKCNYIYM